MSRPTDQILAIGQKLNGWVKIIVLLVAMAAGWATIKAEVTHNREENSRQEIAHEKARQEIRAEVKEDIQDLKVQMNKMDDKLDRIIENQKR